MSPVAARDIYSRKLAVGLSNRYYLQMSTYRTKVRASALLKLEILIETSEKAAARVELEAALLLQRRAIT